MAGAIHVRPQVPPSATLHHAHLAGGVDGGRESVCLGAGAILQAAPMVAACMASGGGQLFDFEGSP